MLQFLPLDATESFGQVCPGSSVSVSIEMNIAQTHSELNMASCVSLNVGREGARKWEILCRLEMILVPFVKTF